MMMKGKVEEGLESVKVVFDAMMPFGCGDDVNLLGIGWACWVSSGVMASRRLSALLSTEAICLD